MTHIIPNRPIGEHRWSRLRRLNPSRHRADVFTAPANRRIPEEAALPRSLDHRVPVTTKSVVHSLIHAVVVHVFVQVDVVKG